MFHHLCCLSPFVSSNLVNLFNASASGWGVMAEWLRAFIAGENVGKEASNSSIFPTTPFSSVCSSSSWSVSLTLPVRLPRVEVGAVLLMHQSRALLVVRGPLFPFLLAASFTFTHREWFTLTLSVGLWIRAQRDVRSILTQKSGMFSRVFGCWV